MASKLLPLLFALTFASAYELTLNQHATLISSSNFPLLRQVTASCSRYMCAPPSMNLAPNVCIHYENDIYYLQSCRNNTNGLTYCSPNLYQTGYDNMCELPPAQPHSLSWPGEQCTTNSSCTTNYCSESNGLCVGATKGESCESNADCNAGLFCTGGQCTKLQGLGQSCTTDYDCENSLGCNRTSLFYGVCLPYFSVPVGGLVSNCNGNSTSYLCTSGTCLQKNFNGAGVCIKPIVSTRQPPQTCQSDQDCVGTSSGQSYQGTCQCGYNPTGAAYCQPFLGDNAGHNWLYYLTELAEMNTTQQCNTNRRFSTACINSLPITWGKTAIAFNMLYNQFAQLQGNDNCIKAIYTEYYWSLSQGYLLAVSAAVLSFL